MDTIELESRVQESESAILLQLETWKKEAHRKLTTRSILKELKHHEVDDLVWKMYKADVKELTNLEMPTLRKEKNRDTAQRLGLPENVPVNTAFTKGVPRTKPSFRTRPPGMEEPLQKIIS